MVNKKTVVRFLPHALIILGLLSLIVGFIIAYKQHQKSEQDFKKALSSHTAPSITKPKQSEIDSYTVAPGLPKFLIIPSQNIKARIVAVGLTKDNAIGSPSNVYDTAWYKGSSKPGQPGAALIDGHVSSWTTNGVFYNLSKLKSGDKFQIQLGDNTLLNYQVVKLQTYDSNNVDVHALLSPVSPNVNGVNLITCSGDVIKGTNEFSKRIVVFASQE